MLFLLYIYAVYLKVYRIHGTIAIDQACIDIVYAMKEDEHHDLVHRIESRHGHRQLSYMKELGMGNDLYKLIDIDNGDKEITAAEAVCDVRPGWTPDRFNTFYGSNKKREDA